MNDITTKITTILKLFYSLFKSGNQIQNISLSVEQGTINTNNNAEDNDDSKTAIEKFDEPETPEISEQNECVVPTEEFEEMERPEIGEKNKWLYPTDGFGKMEHGVVDNESKEGHKIGKKKKKRIIFLD